MYRFGFELEYQGTHFDPNYMRGDAYAIQDDPYILYGYFDGGRNYEICSKPVVGLLEAVKAFRYCAIKLASSNADIAFGSAGCGLHTAVDNELESTWQHPRANASSTDRFSAKYLTYSTWWNSLDYRFGTLGPEFRNYYSNVANRAPYGTNFIIQSPGYVESKIGQSTLNPFAFLKYLAHNATLLSVADTLIPELTWNYGIYGYLVNDSAAHAERRSRLTKERLLRLQSIADDPVAIVKYIKEITNDNSSVRAILAVCNDVARIVNPSYRTTERVTTCANSYNQLGHAKEFVAESIECTQPNALQRRIRAITEIQRSRVANATAHRRPRASASLGASR